MDIRKLSRRALTLALLGIATQGQLLQASPLDDALKALEAAGIKDKETVYDPILKRSIPEVKVGNLYFYKQQQTAE
jgi:hypothetical protein